MESLPPEIIADFRITLNRFSRMVAGIPEKNPGENKAELTALSVEISRCSSCGLSTSGIRSLPSGEIGASIAVLDLDGAITRDADSLELLTRMFQAIDIGRESLYITSVFKCALPSPDSAPETGICTPFLDRELRLCEPVLLCSLGGETTAALTGDTRDISFLHGQKLTTRGLPLFTIRHPRFLLDNPDYKKEAWMDLKTIRDFHTRAANRALS